MLLNNRHQVFDGHVPSGCLLLANKNLFLSLSPVGTSQAAHIFRHVVDVSTATSSQRRIAAALFHCVHKRCIKTLDWQKMVHLPKRETKDYLAVIVAKTAPTSNPVDYRQALNLQALKQENFAISNAVLETALTSLCYAGIRQLQLYC